MSLSRLLLVRPVATTLVTLAIVLAGVVGGALLPVAPLPEVDYATISVYAALPGASPETMATTVAAPLERTLGKIAGVSEMTSSSALGVSRFALQFDLDRDINGAARDVQAAINAARSNLPDLPRNPTYRKLNPADAPIMILALTSETHTQARIYEIASNLIGQRLSKIKGVGEVALGGGSPPAVRVDLNPQQLARYAIPLDEVRNAIAANNVNRPKGALEDEQRRWQIEANDQLMQAEAYRPLVVAYRQGRPVRLSDVGVVSDAVQDERHAGRANGKPSVLLVVYREPGANIMQTVSRIKAELPALRTQIPAAMDLSVTLDRIPSIRTSLAQVEHALMLSVVLVILVVLVFLRSFRASIIPAVVVPVSLIGTLAVMYLCGFSLNSLSLMALTVAAGFVVDDAIVVVENVSRHIEDGMSPFDASLRGVREVGFTVVAMSLSLIAVFIPVLLMGGLPGRVASEFAISLAVAILLSLLLALTTAPVMCARLLRKAETPELAATGSWRAAMAALSARAGHYFAVLLRAYERSLNWALRNRGSMLAVFCVTAVLNVYLYSIIPKGFFPQQDTGSLIGSIEGDQSISFQAMSAKLHDFIDIVRRDPAVESVTGFTGGNRVNRGSMFITLKPYHERTESSYKVIERLRKRLAGEPGARLILRMAQDIQVGARTSSGKYQFSLQADDLSELRAWEPKIRLALSNLPQLQDVSTDAQEKGLQTLVTIDREALARLGLSMRAIDATLNNAFGQRQISTIYESQNQYRVVLGVAPQFREEPAILDQLFLVAPDGSQVPFSAFARYTQTFTSLGVNRLGGFAASTISFNLANDVSLSEAHASILDAMVRIGAPTSIHASFQGSAKLFQQVQQEMPWLIFAALLTVYIVLGILYESFVHPLTILSTLPSAGVGALLALLAFRVEFTIVAFIGVLLLIGIVMKNAIMMIDFALDAERVEKLSPRDAIFKGCMLRFRPIMMTSCAAIFGAMPLAFGVGEGVELGRALGISIIGGLLLSQVLTLYTTPVVYLYLDQLRLWCAHMRARPVSP